MAMKNEDTVSEDGHLHAAAVRDIQIHLPLLGVGSDPTCPLIGIAQEPSPEANDLIKAVDEMLETMTTKFTKISSEVFAKSIHMTARDSHTPGAYAD